MYLFDKKPKPPRPQPLSFKQAKTFEERLETRVKLAEKYPIDKYAMVVVEGLSAIDENSKPYFTMGIEYSMTLLKLLSYIRSKLKAPSRQESYFLKVKNKIRQGTETLQSLYSRFADQDGFLYKQLKKQNTF